MAYPIESSKWFRGRVSGVDIGNASSLEAVLTLIFEASDLRAFDGDKYSNPSKNFPLHQPQQHKYKTKRNKSQESHVLRRIFFQNSQTPFTIPLTLYPYISHNI